MARKRYDENGAELVAGSAAEQLYDEQKAKAVQQANAPLQTNVNTYWGGTTSDQTRAADTAAWDKKLQSINIMRDARNKDIIAEEKTSAVAANAAQKMMLEQAEKNAKNQTDLTVARIRAGEGDGIGGAGTGAGTGGRKRYIPELEAAKIAGDMFEKQQVLPGQTARSYNDIHKEVLTSLGAGNKVVKDANGMVVKDASLSPVSAVSAANAANGSVGYALPGETDAERAQRQAMVPGHKNVSTGPSALTPNQWQQYADAKFPKAPAQVQTGTAVPAEGTYIPHENGINFKSGTPTSGAPSASAPGMVYQGLQPGMGNDQIARFKRADGSAFFANAGAARQRLGDVLTPASAPVLQPSMTMSDDTKPTPKSAVPAITSAVTPASELTVSGQPRPTPPLVEAVTKWKQGLTGPGGNFGDISQRTPTAMDNMLEAAQGVPSSGFVPPVTETMKETPGFLDWWKENRKKLSSFQNPRFSSPLTSLSRH